MSIRVHNFIMIIITLYILSSFAIRCDALQFSLSWPIIWDKVQKRQQIINVLDIASTAEHTTSTTGHTQPVRNVVPPEKAPVGLIVGLTLGLILIFGIVILLLVLIIRYVPKYYNITAIIPYNAELFLSKQWRLKGFSFWNYQKCLS